MVINSKEVLEAQHRILETKAKKKEANVARMNIVKENKKKSVYYYV